MRFYRKKELAVSGDAKMMGCTPCGAGCFGGQRLLDR